MSDRDYEAWRAKQAEEQAKRVEAKSVRDPAAEIFGTGGGIEMDTAPDATDVEPDVEPDVEVVEATPVSKEQEEAHEHAVQKRTDAVWYAVVGVAMLFMSGFHWGIAVGGVLMVLTGGFQYLRWNRRAKAAYDPWDDPEIDRWEENEWGGA